MPRAAAIRTRRLRPPGRNLALQMSESLVDSSLDCGPLIPFPIVRLNRATILLGVILAYVLHAPLITTAIFVIIALAAGFGRRASLIYYIGSFAFHTPPNPAEGGDPRL